MQLSLFSDVLPGSKKANRDQREVWRENFAHREINKIKTAIALNKGQWISGEYKNGKSLIVVQCQCGHQWETRVEYINQGKWCMRCATKIQSIAAVRALHINRIKREVDYILSGRAYFDQYNKNIRKIQRKIRSLRAKLREIQPTTPEQKAKVNKHYKHKYRTNMVFRMNERLSRQLRKCLVKDRKMGSFYKILSYTAQDLKEHIESLFIDGMCWQRISEIHIDHKKPKTLFNLKNADGSINIEEIKKCWSLSNLQPLWAVDNIKKSDNY